MLNLNDDMKEIKLEGLDLDALRVLILQLMNKIEALTALTKAQAEIIQQQRDEIAKLKGEQPKPIIRTQSKEKPKNISSEKERKPPRIERKKKGAKNSNVKIDRTEICPYDKKKLPDDAVFKGYQNVTVQDILFQTDNVLFKREIYYSPSLKRTFSSKLPAGFEGQYGPRLKALVILYHHQLKMTESSILAALTNAGIIISSAMISRILTDNNESFYEEKNNVVEAGVESSEVNQLDDTSGRFRGFNVVVHVLCSFLFTAYFTRKRKDRLTVLEIISQGNLSFIFDEFAYALMEQFNVSEKHINRLRAFYPLGKVMSREEIDALLLNLFPDPEMYTKIRQSILEGSAISWYQKQPGAIKILMVDDAPQFKLITEFLALCWIHDGRHYKKLNPYFGLHILALDAFLKEYWEYYHELLAYKKTCNGTPDMVKAKELSEKFDILFSKTTGYDDLDKRIAITNAKKKELLVCLEYPNAPLHNNCSELGARKQAFYRDSSYHTMSEKGTLSKDAFMTLSETSKKLGVNFYHYLLDRITKSYQMPSLADIIRNKIYSLTPSMH
jgi:hypothetical protein